MKPLATRVLLKLANVAGQDGSSAYRNLWEVAAELGVDRRSIQRSYRELEAAELMHKGDQRTLSHIRADRRPVVYDLNFGWQREFGRPELPMPEDGDPIPCPEASEWGDFHGATNGATYEVPLGTKRTTYLTVKDLSTVPERAHERESNTDASGDSLRDAGASAAPRPDWVGCGRLKRRHELVADGTCCAVCGDRPPRQQTAS
ncbi:helix-turn-helix domain-containing protein [Cryobacterium sp. Y62]|uniref:helix-turn-helix domain-containing protein n=1 Tax=Cryobacterium sp. Y62 TaxID=2048284 RepID=UPI0034CDABA6